MNSTLSLHYKIGFLAVCCVVAGAVQAHASSVCPAERPDSLFKVDVRDRCKALEQDIRKPSALPLDEYETKLGEYLRKFCHRDPDAGWKADKRVRDTGPYISTLIKDGWSGRPFGTHMPVVVRYSPEMFAWLKENRPEDGTTPSKRTPLPDGAIMVKEMYPAPAAACANIDLDRLLPTNGAAVMVRDGQAAADATLAAEKAKKDAPEGSKAAKAIANAKAQAKVASMAGAGLGQVGKAIQALPVPQSEIDSALQKLIEDSEEWNEMVDQVKQINRQMTRFTEEVDGYSRISSNSAAVVTMGRARTDKLGLLDPSASGFVKAMGQRSRHTLTYYLYLMVKAYDTTLLKPMRKINWNLDGLTTRINKLIAEGNFKDFSATDVEAQIKILRPIYKQNVDEVQEQLLTDLQSGSATMKNVKNERGFTPTQGQEVLKLLNAGETALLDPLGLGLVKPNRHLAFLNNFKLTECIFAADSPQLPRNTTMMLTLQPANVGIVRREANLYTLNSRSPATWSWTVTSSGKIDESVPAPIADDILKFILGPGSDANKQLLARPPMWTNLSLAVMYDPPLKPDSRPVIEELIFDIYIDSSELVSPADNLCVLRVLPLNSRGNIVVNCSPADNGKPQRGDGLNHFVRIYNHGEMVQLSVPNSHSADRHFSQWVTGGQQAEASFKEYEEGQDTISITLTDNILADAIWSDQPVQVSSLLKSTGGSKENITVDDSRTAEKHHTTLLLRDEPDDTSPVIALVPGIDAADEHEKSTVEGWRRVNYRGMIGWVQQK